ncbi:MAG: diguanylate cyclase [Pseudomonadales bacterium]
MTRNVKGVERQATLRTIVESMSKHRISCQLVTENEKPVGIITERDMVKLLLATAEDPNMLDHYAEDIMSSPIVTLYDNESLYDAMVVSRAERLRHLPIVDNDGKLQGLVTQSDIAKAHFHVIEIQAELIEKAISERTVDLKQANEELQAMSMEDALMEIGNRRAMEVDLEHTHAASLRNGRQYCVALVDVDYFKKYNDHYGHSAGDEVLRSVAKSFEAEMRKTDRIYRYGGEEMLLLLTDTDADGALVFMKRAIRSLAQQGIPHCESPYGFLTSSAGVAAAVVEGKCRPSWQEVVEKADEALYQSKEASRNTASMAA